MKAEHWNTDGTLPVFRYWPRIYWAASPWNTGTLEYVLFRGKVSMALYKGTGFPVFQCSGSLKANRAGGYRGTAQCSVSVPQCSAKQSRRMKVIIRRVIETPNESQPAIPQNKKGTTQSGCGTGR